ncbi:MAG: dipicolinate synthase subunit B, partial [Clostridiales bacterium]|nr:dipicolinate synthase subunit B [Clostridiales bacterium]
MRELAGARIGCAMTGSFCTFRAAFDAWRALKQTGAEMYPIFSENAYSFDTRFYTAEKAREEMREICGRDIWHTIVEVEPIGPKKLLDLLIIAPCTG